MIVKVFHKVDPNFSEAFFPVTDYKQVAWVYYWGPPRPEVALDLAFQQTNHIEEDWTKNKTLHATSPQRSTSVGDVIVIDDKDIYLCAGVGWQKQDVEFQWWVNYPKETR